MLVNINEENSEKITLPEATIVFCESVFQLLLKAKQGFDDINESINDDEVKEIEDIINNQIKNYKVLEGFSGLKIVNCKLKNKGNNELSLSLGVQPYNRLYKPNGIPSEFFYIGWINGKDLYVSGGDLIIRSSGNSKHDEYVKLDISQCIEAREARERLEGMHNAV